MATTGVLNGRKKGKEREGMGGCSLLCREEEEEMGKRERKGRRKGKKGEERERRKEKEEVEGENQKWKEIARRTLYLSRFYVIM